MPEQLGGAFLVCDGCQTPTAMAGSRTEIRVMALAKGWQVDVGPDSQDFCPACRDDVKPCAGLDCPPLT